MLLIKCNDKKRIESYKARGDDFTRLVINKIHNSTFKSGLLNNIEMFKMSHKTLEETKLDFLKIVLEFNICILIQTLDDKNTKPLGNILHALIEIRFREYNTMEDIAKMNNDYFNILIDLEIEKLSQKKNLKKITKLQNIRTMPCTTEEELQKKKNKIKEYIYIL